MKREKYKEKRSFSGQMCNVSTRNIREITRYRRWEKESGKKKKNPFTTDHSFVDPAQKLALLYTQTNSKAEAKTAYKSLNLLWRMKKKVKPFFSFPPFFSSK